MSEFSERQLNPEQRRSMLVDSNIESLDDDVGHIKVELGQDGKAKAAAFFDIDGTLAHLEFVHMAGIREMYPDEDPDELSKVFKDGFRLGTSIREMYRMHGIYKQGHSEWKDSEVFYKDEYLPKQKQIDSTGFPENQLGLSLLEQYDNAATRAVMAAYEADSSQFNRARIEPVFRLAELYRKLGIPMGVMTANPGKLTRAFAKYLGFSKLFIDLATDETMLGGGKEKAIEYLVDQMEQKGIPVPKDRLILVGDSIRGDVGVGAKLPEDWNAKVRGLVVLENQTDLEVLQQQILNNLDMAKMVQDIDVSGLVVDQVPVNQNGKPMLGTKHRDRFLTKL